MNEQDSTSVEPQNTPEIQNRPQIPRGGRWPRTTKFVAVLAAVTALLGGDSKNSHVNEVSNDALISQIKPQLDAVTEGSYTVDNVQRYGKDWAVADFSQGEDGHVILQRNEEDGSFSVRSGPGTHFDDEAKINEGIPDEVIDIANGPTS